MVNFIFRQNGKPNNGIFSTLDQKMENFFFQNWTTKW